MQIKELLLPKSLHPLLEPTSVMTQKQTYSPCFTRTPLPSFTRKNSLCHDNFTKPIVFSQEMLHLYNKSFRKSKYVMIKLKLKVLLVNMN